MLIHTAWQEACGVKGPEVASEQSPEDPAQTAEGRTATWAHVRLGGSMWARE